MQKISLVPCSAVKTELYVVIVHHYLLLFIRNFLLGLSLGRDLEKLASASALAS